MIVLHGLKNCDTCRKALKELTAAGVDARLRDLREEPVEASEVAIWHDRLGDPLLNSRSTTWRSLSQEARAEGPVALMTAHPALIKRPVVSVENDLYLGWTPQTRAALGLSV